MELILAIDLLGGFVVHGSGGARDSYRPLDWGLSPSAEPESYVASIAPRHVYVADLDRIERRGSHDLLLPRIAARVDRCYVDRGVRSPAGMLCDPQVTEVVGTETAAATVEELRHYSGGYLSLDIRDGRVIPFGLPPGRMLSMAEDMSFDGCILLHLGGVGGKGGLLAGIETLRDAYTGPLVYGGGIAGEPDLHRLADAGFDGAIVATAVHRGTIPIRWVRRGAVC